MASRQPLATSEEVAAYIRRTKRALDQLAYEGRGPRYFKAGRDRLYRWDDVDAWLAENSPAPPDITAKPKDASGRSSTFPRPWRRRGGRTASAKRDESEAA